MKLPIKEGTLVIKGDKDHFSISFICEGDPEKIALEGAEIATMLGLAAVVKDLTHNIKFKIEPNSDPKTVLKNRETAIRRRRTFKCVQGAVQSEKGKISEPIEKV